MASKPNPLSLLLLLLTNIHLISSSSYTTLVYKGCAKQPLTDSQATSSLFGTLVSQSSRQKFFKTSTATSQTTLNGLFQCRSDLTNVDCYNCVSKLPILIDNLCGQTIASRVQLSGCYMSYQVAGFAQVSGLQMVYKTCGKTGFLNGFEEKKNSAFEGLLNGIGSSGIGFYTGVYEGIYVLGQCEGSLGISDCGVCVKSAIQRTQMECGGAYSGQVYLDKCFVGYSYYPNGIPTKSSTFNSLSSPSGTMQNPGKTVAIILGGALVVGFVIICLMFARSSMKKHDDD